MLAVVTMVDVGLRGTDNTPLGTNDLVHEALSEQATDKDSEWQRQPDEIGGLKRERSAVQADAEVLCMACLVAAGVVVEHC